MEILRSKSEEPSSDPISALAAAGNALRDISRRYHFSADNKERLAQAAGLIQKVFIEVTNGTDHETQRIESAEKEGLVLLGEKRYIFALENGHRTAVIEKDGERYTLPGFSEAEHSWGYRGSGPSHLTWKIIEDCFAGDNLAPSQKSEIYGRLYPRVTGAPSTSFVLYEQEIRELV
jgi:hypothetical protein